MTQDSLEDLFDEIRRTYFPRWDRAGRWRFRVALAPGTVCGSYCDTRNRVIYVSPEDARGPDGRAILVHEITHAVTTHEHGELFLERMSKAAVRAEQLGDSTLAEQIRRDVEIAARETTGGYVYGTIRDWVTESDRDITYEAVRTTLAHDCGYTPGYFEKRYPRARGVYEKAKKDAEREAELQAQFRTRRRALE